MAGYTPNLNLYKPDDSDNYEDFREGFNDNMDILDKSGGNQNIATAYNDTQTYAVGDYVIYDGLLYKCDTAVTTAETFDPTKWTHVLVTDEMGSGGGSGGHTIYDKDGNALTQESGLQFTGAVSVSDDSVNGRTVVDITGGFANGVFIDTDNVITSGTYNQNLSYTATQDCFMYVVVATSQGTSSSITIDGQQIYGKYSDSGMQANSILCPIKKGQTIVVSATQNASVDYIVYGLQSGSSGMIYLPTIYSEEERQVGVWKDGRPLYQITLNPSVSVGDNTIAHNIANLRECVSIFGECKYNNLTEYLPLPYTSKNIRFAISLGNVTSTTFLIGVGDGFSSIQDCFVTLQYTKTTDTAGSGDWTPSGARAVHYSTNEQVIGTWIDGKPLYEKTISFGSLPNNTQKDVAHGISDVDLIVKCEGIAYNSSYKSISVPYSNVDSLTYQLQLEVSRTNVSIKTKIDFTGYIGYITLQYTKTTD